MIRKFKIFFTLALAIAGAFIFGNFTSASETSFTANDRWQRLEMTTSMQDSTKPYAMYPVAYIIKITTGSTTRTIFLEGPYYQHGTGYIIPYADIISDFNAEHGSAGKTQAENYFFNYSGTLTLDTVMTLWAKNSTIYSSYTDYRLLLNGEWGYVQAKINDTSHVSTPTKQVSFSNWTSQMKVYPISKFWNWSQKSYAWSYYATWMNNARTTVYTLNPSTFTSNTVRYYTAPNFASNWQDAAMMCEFAQNSVLAMREYYLRSITRSNPRNFSVSIASTSPTSTYESNPVTVTVDWKNHSPTYYSNIPVQIYRAGTLLFSENLTFGPGQTIRRSYIINIGTGTGLKNIQARINYTNRTLESNPNDNLANTYVMVTEFYEFSVSYLEVTPSSVLQNGTVNISFISDNWNTTRSYSNIPVEVILNGTVILTENVSFSPYGENSHSYNLNVGSTLGNQRVTARINWGARSFEVDPNNNITTERIFTVLPQTNLKAEFIDPGADYKEGTEVICAFKITNEGFMHMMPSNELSVRFIAYYMTQQSMPVLIKMEDKHGIVIPASSDNIVYFKLKIPDGIAGRDFRIVAQVDPTNKITESNTTDNSVTVSRNVLAREDFVTPDTQFEKRAPTGFFLRPAPSFTTTQGLSWSKWEWVNGWFSRRIYGIRVDNNYFPEIIPDSNVPTKTYVFGMWHMGSGYGINLNLEPRFTSIGGFMYPEEISYTNPQTVNILFPEFMYLENSQYMRSLEQVSPGVFSFKQNPYSAGNKRIHYTPVWFPDTDYIVQSIFSDIWTPAGMITARLNSNPIRIRGSIYDDWVVGR